MSTLVKLPDKKMYETFGANQIGDGEDKAKVEFKLFFPNETQYIKTGEGKDNNYGNPQITNIKVIGDFENINWDETKAPKLKKETVEKGWLWSYTTDKLQKGFYEYKYIVEFENGEKRKIADPCAKYGGSKNNNSAFVVGGSRNNEVKALNKRLPIRDQIIYELNIDDFTNDYRGVKAPIDAIRDKITHFKDLGINTILFMPWTAWKDNNYNWGYDPTMYFSVEYRLTNSLEEEKEAEKISWLKKLISELHKNDIQVIMDGVFNHVNMDKFPYKELYQESKNCPYTGLFCKVYGGLQDLDFHNKCTQDFIEDVCLYWIDTFKIDGIRFDNTVNFNIPNERRGLPHILESIDKHIRHRDNIPKQEPTNFALTIEHLELDAPDVVNKTEANSYWDNSLHEVCFANLKNGYFSSKIMEIISNDKYLLSNHSAPTYYLSNHDHSDIFWQAGARDNMGCGKWYRVQPYIIALFTIPGIPMMKYGEEMAEDNWVIEGCDDKNRRIKARPLRWECNKDYFGNQVFNHYKKLIQIRKEYDGLRSRNIYPYGWESWQERLNPEGYGVDTEKQILIYHRYGQNSKGKLEKFMIVLNFSNNEQWVDMPFSDSGQWEDLLSGWKVDIKKSKRYGFNVARYWGHIFFKEV